MLKFAYLTAAVLLAPAPAFAQIVFQDSPATAAAPPKTMAKSDLNKIECRTQETIGSRLQSHQVCLTKQQWWLKEQEEKGRVQEIQDRTPARSSG